MKLNPAFFCSILMIFCLGLNAQETKEKKKEKEVLLFHKTEGYWHKSIPTGITTIEELGKKNNFDVDATEDAGDFSTKNLKKYALVIFLNTTGDVLNEKQQKAFRKYIEKGGSYFGIHAATDTEYDWPWYGKLSGAYFKGHPPVTTAKITVEMPEHPTVADLPQTWTRTDEWYNYKDINPEIQVLMKLDESSYEGGENGNFHPIAWYRELEGGGVSIYTGGGHTIESYLEPAFQRHLLECIRYAMGESGKRSDL